jgi:tripartite-type tricarboxylate transporter receptor subunit TctC
VAADRIDRGGAAGLPNRPIRLIVPYTPGTGIDILARLVGQRLSDKLKVAVVVDNRPGASGNIGTEVAGKAAPDGYTLLMTASTHVTNAALQASVPYDAVKGFTPIGPTAIGNLALVVHPSVPAASVKELVALAKREPGKLNYASPGSGTPHHLAMELFKLHFNVDLTHIPYKGTAGAVTDLLGGQVQVMFLPVHVALPQVQSGKLRMLAAGAHRAGDTKLPSLADEASPTSTSTSGTRLGPPALPPSGSRSSTPRSTQSSAIRGPRQPRKQGLNPLPGAPKTSYA